MAGKKRAKMSDELDLIPIMNLVTILIPFLLLAAQFINLAVIDSSLPAIGAPPPEELDDDEKPLNLSLILTGEGIYIAGADEVLAENGLPVGEEVVEPTVPCKRLGCPDIGDYDGKELTRLLGLIKDEYPTDENVILVPEAAVHYELLIVAMDAAREDPTTMMDGKPRVLFPFVVIAGGAE